MNPKYAFVLLLLFQVFIQFPSCGSDLENDRVDELYHKAWSLLEVDLDSARKYAGLQMRLARDSNYELGMIKAYYVIGFINYLQDDFNNAAINYFHGLKLASKETSREYKTRKMLLLQNLAAVYEKTCQPDDAIMYTKEAAGLAKELGRHKNLGQLYFNLGYFYYLKEDYNNALNWFATTEDHLSQFPDDYQLAKTYNLVGSIYNRTAQYDRAREQYLKVLKISDGVETLQQNRVYYVNNLGENALKSGNPEKAMEYYNQALELALQFDDPAKIKLVANNLGDVYLKKKKYHEAIKYYERTLSLGRADVIDKEYRRASKNMAIAYEKLADYKNSLTYQKQLVNQSDLLQSTQSRLAAYRTEMKERERIENDQKQQSRLKAKEREALWFKISISVLFILLIYAAYKAIRYYQGIRSGLKLRPVDSIYKPSYIEELTQKMDTLLENLKRPHAPGIHQAYSSVVNGEGLSKTDTWNQDFHGASREFNLTKREVEISSLIAEGHTQQQIADLLHISSKTVSKHIQNIYFKAGVSNKVELLRKLNSID